MLPSRLSSYEFFNNMDEVAVFYEARTASQIYSDYNDVKNYNGSGHYQFAQLAPPTNLPSLIGDFDVLEHPLNYAPVSSPVGDYSSVNTAETQIKKYPLPRYATTHSFMKNVDWLNAMWLVKNEGSLADQILSSVTIKDELARRWNYYFNVSNHLSNQTGLLNNSSNNIYDAFPKAWVNAANNTSDYSLSVITLRGQSNPNSVLGVSDNPCQLNEPAIRSEGLSTCTIPGVTNQLTYLYNNLTTKALLRPRGPGRA